MPRFFTQSPACSNSAAAKNWAAIAGEDFDRLVPGHGEVVETGGKAGFLAALRERDLA